MAIIPGATQPHLQQVNLTPPSQVVVAPQGNGGVGGSVLPRSVVNPARAPRIQAQPGNPGTSGSVLPLAVDNPAMAPLIQAHLGNGSASGSVLPIAVVNPAPAPLIQAQPGNCGASGTVVPVPLTDNSDHGEGEIVRVSPDNHPMSVRLLQAHQRDHQARNIVPTG